MYASFSRLDDVTYGSFIAQFGYKNKVGYIHHCVHYMIPKCAPLRIESFVIPCSILIVVCLRHGLLYNGTN